MSMSDRAAALAQAHRHLLEAETHVARQVKLIENLERDGHVRLAAQAREVLHTLEHTLNLARDHLRLEQEHYDRSLASRS